MTTINLYQNQSEKESQVLVRNANKGFFFSLGVLGVTLLVLLGVKLYVPRLEGENAKLETSLASENVKVVGLKELEQIMDIQKRSDEIKKNLKIVNGKISRLEISRIMDMVAAEMVGSVVVSSFDYSNNGKISINFAATSFSDASKQIFNFKNSDNFSAVNLDSFSRESDGIDFTMGMNLK